MPGDAILTPGPNTDICLVAVAWVCHEADVPFGNEAYGFLEPVLKSPGYLAINPNGLIPALREDEFVLWESLAVNLYLAKKHVPKRAPDEVARSTGLVQRALAVLDGHLWGRAYLLGDRFSIADLNVACVLSFDQHARIALPGGVHRWLHACWSRPACPRRDVLVESLKTLGPPPEACGVSAWCRPSYSIDGAPSTD